MFNYIRAPIYLINLKTAAMANSLKSVREHVFLICKHFQAETRNQMKAMSIVRVTIVCFFGDFESVDLKTQIEIDLISVANYFLCVIKKSQNIFVWKRSFRII